MMSSCDILLGRLRLGWVGEDVGAQEFPRKSGQYVNIINPSHWYLRPVAYRSTRQAKRLGQGNNPANPFSCIFNWIYHAASLTQLNIRCQAILNLKI